MLCGAAFFLFSWCGLDHWLLRQPFGGVTWNCRKQRRGPVAEMQAPLRKIGLESEQPEHRVTSSRGVDQAGAKRHVAAALAVHRARLRKGAKAVCEARRGGQLAGVQFRITARKPGDVTGWVWRLVGKRREGDDFGSCRAPTRHQMRIQERERHV